ncbi:MAG: hypothetical protein KDK90_28345 [Leptospiraceae bacterium]|nr:hypothetical protein [Leptospiraceae bacterium]
MKIRITIITLILISFSNCSSLQLDKHDGFWEWFIGKPGGANAMKISDKPRNAELSGSRHLIYLWLRTPEIILNPQGGLYYSDMILEYEDDVWYNTSELESIKDEKLKRLILKKRNKEFHMKESGLIDFIFAYREIFDPSGDIDNVMGYCVGSPIHLLLYIHRGNLVPKLFYYPIHDVIKTVMIPVAAVYYTIKAFDDNDEEEPEE